MENEKNRVKRFVVTQSLRFPNTAMKLLYYASFAMIAAAVIIVGICLASGTRGIAMGIAVVAGVLGIIWMVAAHLISENTFGFSAISFGEEYIMFYSGEEKFKLRWENVTECGIEKTRRAYWVYASDHKLSDAEKKEFPENTEEGVFYFNYYYNTWDEFMKFVPDKFKAELEEKKSALKITDKGRM